MIFHFAVGIGLIIATLVIVAKIINIRTAKKAEHIPGVSLLSNLSLFLNPQLNFHLYSERLIPTLEKLGVKQNGGGHLYRITVGGVNYIINTSPAVFHEVAVSKYKLFDRPPDFCALTNFNPHSKEANSLFGCSHEPGVGAWKRIRAIVDRAFTDNNLRKILERGTYDVVNNLLKKWRSQPEGQTVDASADMDATVMDMIAQGGYGIKTDCVNGNDMIFPRMVKNIFRTMLLFIVMRRSIVKLIPFAKTYYYFWPEWRKLLGGFIDVSRQRMLDEPGVHQGDILSAMIKTSDEQSALSTEEMIKTLSDLTIAANDTTSATLQFALYEIAKQKQIQENIRQEIDALYEKRDVDSKDSLPTFDEIVSEMPYTKAVMQEALRKYPVAPYIVRYATRDVKLDNNTLIPKHSQVVNVFRIMHNDPEIWGPDAHEFKPERFVNDAVFEKVPRSAHSPFAAGPRNCVGKRLAEMEIILTLSTLVRNYNLELFDKGEMETRTIITAHPLRALKLKISKRNIQ
ncbi:cytochrome P450 [Acrasis kona]|uniref:Cytochrome P450 n=1 Tax=Acrasis kona TaxID=1008807 RepID=A0AAW2YLQ2_9EUKA